MPSLRNLSANQREKEKRRRERIARDAERQATVHPVLPGATVHPAPIEATVHPASPEATVHPASPEATVHPASSNTSETAVHPVSLGASSPPAPAIPSPRVEVTQPLRSGPATAPPAARSADLTPFRPPEELGDDRLRFANQVTEESHATINNILALEPS